MAKTLEIVYFRVPAERVPDLLSTRAEALDAIREHFPGLISAHMGRLEDDRWVDAVVWETREQALAAAEGAMTVPTFARWCALITEVLSIEHADLHD